MDDLITFLQTMLDADEGAAKAAAIATGMVDNSGPMAWHASGGSVYAGLADLQHSARCDQHDEVPNDCDDLRVLEVDADFCADLSRGRVACRAP